MKARTKLALTLLVAVAAVHSRSHSLQQPGLHADTLILHPYCHSAYLGRSCADFHPCSHAYTCTEPHARTCADRHTYTHAEPHARTCADRHTYAHADPHTYSYAKARPPAYSAEHWP